ncbi:hypothetical protein Cadr_000026388, partial [Camelus dromedarius]
ILGVEPFAEPMRAVPGLGPEVAAGQSAWFLVVGPSAARQTEDTSPEH